MDVEILHDHRSTEHRVILGHEYYQVYGLEPQDAAAVIFELLLHKKVARQTDGTVVIAQPFVCCWYTSNMHTSNMHTSNMHIPTQA